MGNANISRKPTDKATSEAFRNLEVIIKKLQQEIESLKARVSSLGG